MYKHRTMIFWLFLQLYVTVDKLIIQIEKHVNSLDKKGKIETKKPTKQKQNTPPHQKKTPEKTF